MVAVSSDAADALQQATRHSLDHLEVHKGFMEAIRDLQSLTLEEINEVNASLKITFGNLVEGLGFKITYITKMVSAAVGTAEENLNAVNQVSHPPRDLVAIQLILWQHIRNTSNMLLGLQGEVANAFNAAGRQSSELALSQKHDWADAQELATGAKETMQLALNGTLHQLVQLLTHITDKAVCHPPRCIGQIIDKVQDVMDLTLARIDQAQNHLDKVSNDQRHLLCINQLTYYSASLP
jgi:hypothetical protein